jgi:glycine/D-amino acid oxidase-like deaminating enzyme
VGFFFIIVPMNNLWEATAERPPESEPLEGSCRVDVVVIGAGFTGCAAALRLAQASADVCVIEAEDIGHGASGRNVGLVNAGLWVEPKKIEAELGQERGQRLNDVLMRAPNVVFDLIEQHRIACEATRVGTLQCAHSPGGFRKLERRAEQLIAGGTPVKLLSPDEAREKTGSDVFHGALLDPRAGTIQPLSYVRGLAKAASRVGAKFYTHSPVNVLAYDGQQWHVATSRGSVNANSLIVATNAYTASLAAMPSFVSIHYCQFATAPLGKDLARAILPERQGAWDTATVMSSFRMDNSDRLIIGGIGQLDGPGASAHATWAGRKLKRLFPLVPAKRFEFGWSGRMAITGDRLPKIAKIGPGGLMVHGYNGRGIGPGTIFGTSLADYILSSDESVLPLPVLGRHNESFRTIKSWFYEAGAIAVHLASGWGR